MTIGVLPANQFVDDPLHSPCLQQLSSLMDGELEADQAQFLLRRISHDEALVACQERWQLIGDVLRGQSSALAPAGFAKQVQQVLGAETAINQKTPYLRWKPWGAGMALAASIAAVSVLFVTRISFTPASVETALSAADISTDMPSPALVVSPETPVSVMPVDPFALVPEPAAKPWPRSTLPAVSGTFNAQALSQNEPFYPFTPLAPSSDSVSSH